MHAEPGNLQSQGMALHPEDTELLSGDITMLPEYIQLRPD
jgi:hypothetical protein